MTSFYARCHQHWLRQVRVIRNGQEVGLSTYDLLVGDVLVVATGDILPADGLLFQGNDIRCCSAICCCYNGL